MVNESEVGNESLVGVVKEIPKEEKQWAMFIHLSSFLGYFTGLGFILAPLILWLLKKEGNPFVDAHGKEAMNFQISLMIYGIIVAILCLVLIGFLLIPVLLLSQFILTIIAGVKASEGKEYRYPMTIRFIK